MNLKTDGLDYKMIFKFGKHVERLHSARKQGRRIYIVCICKQCVCLYKHHLHCKILVGKSQSLELHLVDAGCFRQIKMEKLIYFLRNSPYSHSANADIIALYLLVSSNREEKASCASR